MNCVGEILILTPFRRQMKHRREARDVGLCCGNAMLGARMERDDHIGKLTKRRALGVDQCECEGTGLLGRSACRENIWTSPGLRDRNRDLPADVELAAVKGG